MAGSTALLKKLKYTKNKILVVFEALESSTVIEETKYSLYKSQIDEYLGSIALLEDKVVDTYLSEEVDEEILESFTKDSALFKVQALEKLSAFKPSKEKGNDPNFKISKGIKGIDLTPKIVCPKFNDKDLETDKLAYLNFHREFLNCVSNLDSDALKLVVLKNHLTGYPFQVIKHLSVSDENYAVALELLSNEFLDEKCIVDSIFSSLLNVYRLHNNNDVKKFLTDVKTQLYELKNSFELDFFEENSPGNRLLSHIIFSKLPASFRTELVHKVNTNYPSLEQILENSTDIFRTLEFCSYSSRNDLRNRKADFFKGKNKFKHSLSENKPSTLENFHVKAYKVKFKCCFCKTNNHLSRFCEKFPTYRDRFNQCKELKICMRCTSSSHPDNLCPYDKDENTLCWSCNKPGHLSVMCPSSNKPIVKSNACWLNTSASLLPVIGITVEFGSKCVTFNCLLDTGSERSYLCKEFSDKFVKEKFSPLDRRKYLIKTFMGCQERNLNELALRVKFPDATGCINFLIDEQLDLSFRMDGLGEVITDLNKSGVKLAADFSELKDDVLKVHGLIGIDIIKFLGPLKLTKVKNGSAFESSLGMILFGDITDFKPCNSARLGTGLNYNRVVNEFASYNVTHVYFALEPKSNHLDPWGSLDEASVDRGIEQMFKLESLGITDEVCSDYDKTKIEEFRSSIEYRDDSYYIGLSWDLDKLKEVPSNHQVSLAVLDRVVDKLSIKNLYSDYCKVFLDQEAEGVIERIYPTPSEFYKYTWIPHRPVFKSELQCTTKIRPVFNCSLRVNKKPSLNDCAYSGINLYTDMLELLFKFRTDKFVLLADIRKAFLMIKLKNDFDKNRFCFFLKINDELVCFRYKTLIFGFISSPFILSYIVKHHVEKYSSGLCREMLLNNFYVDNLVKTHRSPDELLKLYIEAVDTMSKGSFLLKTCCSNSKLVSSRIQLDNNSSSHGMSCEKVLGYWYNPESDEMGVSKGEIKKKVSTKRDMLSVGSSIFDPLGLVLPITIKGKIILSQVWKSGITWDQVVPDELLSAWNSFQVSLRDIQKIGFKRCSVQTDLPVVLIMFCDASSLAYGIVEYMYQGGKASLFYAKAKVAPSVKRTLPTLELLAVYLGVKHVLVLIEMFPNLFREIIIAVDAQVILSWLLSESVHTKCQFTKNRIKDIKSMVNEINCKGYTLKFRYVSTSENPADLLTRGVSMTKFVKEKDFWLKGPTWLQTGNLEWPDYRLDCISNKCRTMVTAYTSLDKESDSSSVIRIEKFSSLKRLIGTLVVVFKFIAQLKGDNRDIDFYSKAKSYLIKTTQNEFFVEEKHYFENKDECKIPPLVNEWNLFLDDNDLLRCRGRIENTEYFSEDVKNPILLPKVCHFTSLIVMECHIKCKHLGIAATLAKVRNSGFWIPKARQAIKTVLADCMICKKYNSLSFRYPKMTNLPKHRVNLVRPFYHTGIDFTGHLWVVDGSIVKKMYILIFTCFSVRAIHIELVAEMSTQAVVLAFLRFFNIYGVPSHIYSDNALSFVAGCDIVKKVLISDEFRGNIEACNIKHCRIPLYSAWFGAIWERLIKTVKSCLFKVIGRKRLDYFQLLTVLSDIQKSVNDRPLTYRCSDDSSLEVIAPSAFMRFSPGKAVFLNFEDDSFVEVPPNRIELIESLKYRESLLTKFKLLWYEQYLLSLRELSKDLHHTEFSNKIKVDDIVLIKSFVKPRPYWNLGRVVKLTHGSDGMIRSALIKKGETYQEHSIKHLFPIELSISHSFQAKPKRDDVDSCGETNGESNTDKNEMSNSSRTRRSVKDRNPEYVYY